MKLYTSIGPNPRVVNMFIAEKQIDVPTETIDLMGGENRREPHLKRNPAGQSPCLELDDGSYLSEITAICEYLEEKHPEPSLLGKTPEERAKTRMWARRIDLNILEPMANGFRFAEGLQLFQNRVHVIPQAADDLKAVAREKLAWLDGLLAGNEWVCGDRFSLADILLYSFVDFGSAVGQPLAKELAWLPGWRERVAKRPSAEATKG